MESNWRWNVWETGLSLSGVRLYARYVGDPPVFGLVDIWPATGRPAIVAQFAPEQVPIFWEEFVPPGDMRFPWGQNVEPD